MIGTAHNIDPGSQVCSSIVGQDKRSKLASTPYNVVEIIISSTFSMTTGFFLIIRGTRQFTCLFCGNCQQLYNIQMNKIKQRVGTVWLCCLLEKTLPTPDVWRTFYKMWVLHRRWTSLKPSPNYYRLHCDLFPYLAAVGSSLDVASTHLMVFHSAIQVGRTITDLVLNHGEASFFQDTVTPRTWGTPPS